MVGHIPTYHDPPPTSVFVGSLPAIDTILVTANWSYPTGVNSILNLVSKLRRLKQCLEHWNRSYFGDIFESLQQGKDAVSTAERVYDVVPSNANLIELNHCTTQWQHALAVEEDYWRQKSACKWVLQGERNTRYFHSLVKKKRPCTLISFIMDGDHTLTANDDIRPSGAAFYHQLLTATNPAPR
ncbi:hypothetical protein Salat_2705200 [Sesamum alatum]|uniref:Uncharacterized protein n=1 Tax=Sesamum alatum TaxID=300844 RepID=A0AAE1XR33_9LAMI|nr:hypothetical protein Salat_2705200 [Sesamum alatum]